MINIFQNEFVDVLKKIYREKYNFLEELNYFHKILESQTISEEDKVSNKKIIIQFIL